MSIWTVNMVGVCPIGPHDASAFLKNMTRHGVIGLGGNWGAVCEVVCMVCDINPVYSTVP